MALCESGRRENILMLLESLDITEVSPVAYIERVFRSLGKLLLEPFAERLLEPLGKRYDNRAKSNVGVSGYVFIVNEDAIREQLKSNNIDNRGMLSAQTYILFTTPNSTGIKLIEKLFVKTPYGEIKLKVLKEIAKEYHIQWDTTESEEELLKPPKEHIWQGTQSISANWEAYSEQGIEVKVFFNIMRNVRSRSVHVILN